MRPFSCLLPKVSFGSRWGWWRAVAGSEFAVADAVCVTARGQIRMTKSDETKLKFRDRGWRILGVRVSGKRTDPQGESRLIKANQSEKRGRKGMIKKLGQEVGERGRRLSTMAAVRL